MRRFSFRPSLTLRGRKFKGPRGWAGKPLHPPLTAIPIGAYCLAAAFDVISYAFKNEEWARDFFRAGTFALVGGAILSLFTVLTGFWDWLRSTEPGTQARRTVNAHAITMVAMTALVLTGIVLRLVAFEDDAHTPVLALALSVASVLLVAIGGTIGGSLTYDYGFNVETAGDHPVWHQSERDVFPGEHDTDVSLSDDETEAVEELSSNL